MLDSCSHYSAICCGLCGDGMRRLSQFWVFRSRWQRLTSAAFGKPKVKHERPLIDSGCAYNTSRISNIHVGNHRVERLNDRRIMGYASPAAITLLSANTGRTFPPLDAVPLNSSLRAALSRLTVPALRLHMDRSFAIDPDSDLLSRGQGSSKKLFLNYS